MRHAFLRVMLFAFPVVLWLGVGVLAATELGSYGHSWELLHRFMDTIEPGFYTPDPQIVSMYQVTQVMRKLAHVVIYFVLTLLLVRLGQRGNPRPRVRVFLVSLGIAALFMGAESVVRVYQGEGLRHVRPEQFFLNGIGVLSAIALALCYFGLKALERSLVETKTGGV